MRNKSLTIVIIIIISAFAISCTSDKSRWKKAEMKNSIVAYEEFLKEYPNSIYYDSALIRLNEEKAWKQLMEQPYSIKILNDYQANWPQNKHKSKINMKIDSLHVLMWKSLVKTDYDDIASYINDYPKSPYYEEASQYLLELQYGIEIPITIEGVKFRVLGFKPIPISNYDGFEGYCVYLEILEGNEKKTHNWKIFVFDNESQNRRYKRAILSEINSRQRNKDGQLIGEGFYIELGFIVPKGSLIDELILPNDNKVNMARFTEESIGNTPLKTKTRYYGVSYFWRINSKNQIDLMAI